MMKRKKKGTAAPLHALAKEGRRFDRATLDAMLDKMAKLKPVETFPVHRATCYVRLAPPAKYGEYICPQCGARTYYLSCETPGKIAPYQEWAKELRGLGLDISVDETAFCSVCSKDTKLKPKTMPTQGRLKKIGRTVGIVGMTDNGGICIDSADIDALWISPECVDAKGNILGDDVDVHLRNSKGADLVISAKGTLVADVPARPGDDPAWVRVRIPLSDAGQFPFRNTELIVDAEDITVTKTESVVCWEPAVYWVINGKRTEAERTDFYILLAFLKKKKGVNRYANYGRSLPIQTALPRLRELLGENSRTRKGLAKAGAAENPSASVTERLPKEPGETALENAEAFVRLLQKTDIDFAMLDDALDYLAKNKKRKRRSPAMRVSCYMPLPMNRSEYICPKCGARTSYLSDNVADKIERFQKTAERLRGLGLDISVDAGAFCSTCFPKISKRFAYWVINGKRIRTGPRDCSLLEKYFEGRKHCERNMEEPPKLSSRLRELLGTEKE